MSAETTIVKITTTVKDTVVSQAGFGMPLIFCDYPMPERVLGPISDPDALLEAPYSLTTAHPAYKIGKAIMSQEIAPSGFKLGKRALKQTQFIQVAPRDPVEGDVFDLSIDGTKVSVTAGASPSEATVVSQLQAAMDAAAPAGVTVAAVTGGGGDYVAVTATTAGELHAVETETSRYKLRIKDGTPDPGIATDLAAVALADAQTSSPGFYGLLIDSNAEPQIAAAAAWAESRQMLFFATSGDTEIVDATVTNDIASDLKTAGYHKTVLCYHPKPVSQPMAAAWVGRMFPKKPGQADWYAKTLAGIDAVSYTDAELAAIQGKNANVHARIGGNGWTKEGFASSGRFIDVTRFTHWFVSRWREAILKAFLDNDKISYTDEGVQVFKLLYFQVVNQGISNGAIDAASPITIYLPPVATQLANDIAARHYTGIKYAHRFASGVHTVEIDGELSV